jgi:hypothetical protein
MNEGRAIKIRTTAGKIVQITSIVVPWIMYLYEIGFFPNVVRILYSRYVTSARTMIM